jgi:hypothetical protein
MVAIPMKRRKLKQLKNMGVKEQYCITIWNKFAGLQNLDDKLNITRTLETECSHLNFRMTVYAIH